MTRKATRSVFFGVPAIIAAPALLVLGMHASAGPADPTATNSECLEHSPAFEQLINCGDEDEATARYSTTGSYCKDTAQSYSQLAALLSADELVDIENGYSCKTCWDGNPCEKYTDGVNYSGTSVAITYQDQRQCDTDEPLEYYYEVKAEATLTVTKRCCIVTNPADPCACQ